MILTRATQILDDMQWENICLFKKRKHETQHLQQSKQKHFELSQIGNNERIFIFISKKIFEKYA
jgi:hypothetical protein